MEWSKEWYLDKFDSMNKTPKQKWLPYHGFIGAALKENMISDKDRLQLIQNIYDSMCESINHEES